MQIWNPDTCYCEIESERPSIPGKFIHRCTIHENSRTTLDVYDHNVAHRARANEIKDTSDPDVKDVSVATTRKRLLRESTRP